jgi:hypothetical protein
MTNDVERSPEAIACPEPFDKLKINSLRDGNLPLLWRDWPSDWNTPGSIPDKDATTHNYGEICQDRIRSLTGSWSHFKVFS